MQDRYDGLITSTPLALYDPAELISQLQTIYNVQQDGDPNNTGMTRESRLFNLLHITHRALAEMSAYADHTQTQFEELINHLRLVLPAFNYTPSHVTSANALSALADKIKQIRPKEGNMM